VRVDSWCRRIHQPQILQTASLTTLNVIPNGLQENFIILKNTNNLFSLFRAQLRLNFNPAECSTSVELERGDVKNLYSPFILKSSDLRYSASVEYWKVN